jgi:diguanylate cyclase (GGDEF)-like protein
MARSVPRALRRYIASVVLAGWTAAAIVFAGAHRFHADRGAVMLVLVGAAILAELAPIRIPFRGGVQDVSVSTTFVFALVLLRNLPAALAAQVAASVLSDLVGRKPWWKQAFNASQYAISVTAAGAVYDALAPGSILTHRVAAVPTLVGAIAAAAVLYISNNVLVSTAIALADGSSLRAAVSHDLLFQATTSLVLTSQSLPVLLVVERSPLLLPLFVPPLLAAYQSARTSAQRDHQALHQALSGLPNRDFFNLHLARALEGNSPRLGVMIVDLDRFRAVNDTLGHALGDQLLIETGERLVAAVGPDDFVAHFGGDEFAVLAPLSDDRDYHDVAARVAAALDAPFDFNGLPFLLESGLGVALAPEHGREARVLLQRADIALHEAKQQGKRIEVYREAIDAYDPRRLALLGELRDALTRDELVVHYQPKVSLRTGDVVSVEALVRWNHPRYGLFFPNEFIGVAEATRLIDPLTDIILRRALTQCAYWRSLGRSTLSVAVNVSARSLYDDALVERLAAHLREQGLPADALQIEVTESAAMQDPEVARGILGRIRDLGVRIALDDFGTGHASLAHLQRLPVDEIKIDKSFVIGMPTSVDDTAIVASTISLAHALRLSVVAEGVENERVWQQLSELGCDVAQGYLISRPIPAERFEVWLATYSPDRTPVVGPGGTRPVGPQPAAVRAVLDPSG